MKGDDYTGLVASIRDDLQYLREALAPGGASESTVRRCSGVLRRLLIDDAGGSLGQYRRMRPGVGELRIRALDVKSRQGNGFTFLAAGGGTYQGLRVFEVQVLESTTTTHGEPVPTPPRRPVPVQLVPKELSLPRFLDSACMLIEDKQIRRRDVIQYIANRLGGVHYDERRDPAKDQAFILLDGVRDSMITANLKSVYFELLSIGQALLDTPELVAITQETAGT